MINITEFKAKVTPKLHGTTLSKIADVFGKLGEAAGNLLLRIDPYTTIRRQRIENAIYDKVYNYTAPTDLKGLGKVLDIRPIGERLDNDDIRNTFSKEFDIKKEKDRMTIEMINGTKTLRLSKVLAPRTILHRGDSDTLEGTVTLAGDASGLEIDYLDFVSGSASLKFALDGVTGSASITYALPNTIDLETLEDLGALFNWIEFPDVARLNSITLQWGSSSSDYWQATAQTAAHDREFESNAWMLIRSLWSTATPTGSPDSSAIDHIKITISYDTGVALSNVRVDSISASLGQAWEILYYSGRLFKGVDGTYKEAPTLDTDIIQLENTEVNILMYEFMMLIAQEIKGSNMNKDIEFYSLQLEGNGRDKLGLYKEYTNQNPSQALVLQNDYHEFGDLE